MVHIGISGHRGSGKTSVAFILGCFLEYMKRGHNEEQLKGEFNNWCDNIKNNGTNAIYDACWNYVYFDEFGEIPKSFVAQLLGIDMSVLDSDTLKDTMYVNMKDFKLSADVDTNKIVTPEQYLSSVPHDKPKLIRRLKTDSYMNLRDFMKMFSVDIMQRIFGTNVWIKTRVRGNEQYGEVEDGWRIFSDVKIGDELLYIREKEGIVIKVQRPTHKKKNNGITNIEDASVDYNVVINSDISEMFDELYKIAKEIYER